MHKSIEILGYNSFIESRGGGDHGYNDMEQIDLYYKEGGLIYKYHLDNDYGDCSSGRTSATWGRKEITCVEKVGPLHYTPIEKIIISDIEKIIYCDNDGGDHRYPTGSTGIQKKWLSKFKKSIRVKDKRQVYLFQGESGIGKSFLAHKLDLSVYETDSNNVLLDDIRGADIVVIGNKYNISVDEIKKKIGEDVDFINVLFTY